MIWTDAAALSRAHYYLQQANVPWTSEVTLHNFNHFYNRVVDVIADMTPRQREGVPREWAARFAALGGDFDKRVKRDPTLLYLPRTVKHQAFHDSNAFVRYLISANGIGKTLMCYMELIWRSTGQRHYSGEAANSIVVSTGHAGYSTDVFTRKMVEGEDKDPYSPYVPEDGYWFHSFDRRNYILRLACAHCAEAGKPRDCSHTKSIKCLSADSGKDRLMGFTASLGLVDEHIPEDVWGEIVQRVIRVQGRMMVAATPLAGPDSWEVKQLYSLWKDRPEDNWRSRKDHSLGRYVDVFQISKYDCIGTHNGPTEESIAMEKATLPSSEFRVRVMGEPIPLGDSLFDLNVLDKLEQEYCRPATFGRLNVIEGEDVATIEYVDSLLWQTENHHLERTFEGFHVWEPPERGGVDKDGKPVPPAQYVIGADSASGVAVGTKDASVAYVYKILQNDSGNIDLRMVACHYSYIDVYDYAAEVKKLAIYYNQACVVPEVVGIGAGFMTTLVRQLNYPSVYLGETGGEMLEGGPEHTLGVRTNAQNKPMMIRALRTMVENGEMTICDKEAISECRTFQQTRTESGLNYRYAAAQGAHDDRVMAMAMVAYAVKRDPDQVMALSMAPTVGKKPSGDSGPGHKPRKRFNF